MAAKVKRGRNWTIIVYPDSAPDDWRDQLDQLHIQWIESPLHDKDTNPDGTVKKAHWHVLLLFEGNKSYQQVKDITAKLNTVNPQRVESARGMVRYMVHLDNPEKYQYDVKDIKAHGGADIDSLMKPTTTNRLQTLKEIIAYIHDNQVTNFMDLLMYAIQNNDDWFNIMADYNTLFITKAIDAEWQKSKAKPATQPTQGNHLVP